MTNPFPTPPAPVGPGAVAEAFGLSRSTFLRAVKRGWISPSSWTPDESPAGTLAPPRVPIPAPAARTAGGHRQWSVEQLPKLGEALKALGREIPKGWEPAPSLGSVAAGELAK